MEYSPFKDYLNLCLFLQKDKDVEKNTEKKKIWDEGKEFQKIREVAYEWNGTNTCLQEESDDEDMIEKSRFIESLLSDPPSPDSVCETEVFDFQFIKKENENYFTAVQTFDQTRIPRKDSLSSSQYSSSADDSFEEDTNSEAYASDYILSAFLGQFNFNTENIVQNALQYQVISAKPVNEKFCILCKRNGETREYYTTHVLKDIRGKVICPVLRKYICPKCSATGDNAHTLRHCPLSDTQGSTTETCYTLRSSCGKRRKKIV